MKINQLKTLIIILLLVLGVTLNAQDEETKDKLADLKGKVEKVTIKVNGKDVVFEGKEAERIAKLAKATGAAKTFVFTSKDGNVLSETVKLIDGVNLDDKDFDVKIKPGSKKRVKIFKSEGGENVDVIATEGFDWKVDGDQKKVKVEIKDGKKNITVTTMKDGKEETKTYEGEEAEKFLKEQGGDGKVKVIMKKLGDEDCEYIDVETDHMIMFNKKIGGGCNCCCNGGGIKNMKMMHGGKGNFIWKMMDDDSEDKEVHVIVEKKAEKKKEIKETKKEEKNKALK